MSTVSRKWTKAVRRDKALLNDRLEKWNAWKKGKKVFLTIENTNSRETNKPFVRVPASDVWGKYIPYQMKTKSEDEL